jgi:hypothetical protein
LNAQQTGRLGELAGRWDELAAGLAASKQMLAVLNEEYKQALREEKTMEVNLEYEVMACKKLSDELARMKGKLTGQQMVLQSRSRAYEEQSAVLRGLQAERRGLRARGAPAPGTNPFEPEPEPAVTAGATAPTYGSGSNPFGEGFGYSVTSASSECHHPQCNPALLGWVQIPRYWVDIPRVAGRCSCARCGGRGIEPGFEPVRGCGGAAHHQFLWRAERSPPRNGGGAAGGFHRRRRPLHPWR